MYRSWRNLKLRFADTFTLWWAAPAHPRCGAPKTSFVLGDRRRQSRGPMGADRDPVVTLSASRIPTNTGNGEGILSTRDTIPRRDNFPKHVSKNLLLMKVS